MRELKIEEQKSICGGTTYYFTDLTTGSYYTNTSFDDIDQYHQNCIDKGHKVTPIRHIK